MRRRNRPARARRGIALGWVLAILLVLIIVIVVWLVRQPGPGAGGTLEGGPEQEQEQVEPDAEEGEGPEEPGEPEAEAEPEAADEAADGAEEPADEVPEAQEQDGEAAPQEGEADGEQPEEHETEPEVVEAEIEAPDETEALFTEGDRQVDAGPQLDEATQALSQALERAESGMADLRRPETPRADVPVDEGAFGAPAEEAQQDGARVAQPEVSLQALQERTRTLAQDVGESMTRPQAPGAAEEAPSLPTPEPTEGEADQTRVRTAEGLGEASQDALQRTRERLDEAQRVNDAESP